MKDQLCRWVTEGCADADGVSVADCDAELQQRRWGGASEGGRVDLIYTTNVICMMLWGSNFNYEL